jgi:hypothetical protein
MCRSYLKSYQLTYERKSVTMRGENVWWWFLFNSFFIVTAR